MHFDQIPTIVISAAGWTVGSFVFAVILDNVLGIAGAVRSHTFSTAKLPSFLASQFGTRQAIALGGLVIAATITGGDIKAALLAALTAGGSALTLSVIADIYGKMKALVGAA